MKDDGDQHFRQVWNWDTPGTLLGHSWDTPENIQIKDRHKERVAIKNGYSVIGLLSSDIYRDKKYKTTGETLEKLWRNLAIYFILPYRLCIRKKTCYLSYVQWNFRRD